jgi:hypothetical protein
LRQVWQSVSHAHNCIPFALSSSSERIDVQFAVKISTHPGYGNEPAPALSVVVPGTPPCCIGAHFGLR